MTGRHPQSVGLYPGVLFADSLQGNPGHDGDEGSDDDDGQSVIVVMGVMRVMIIFSRMSWWRLGGKIVWGRV